MKLFNFRNRRTARKVTRDLAPAMMESLESRQLMSVTDLAITEIMSPNDLDGTDLHVTVQPGDTVNVSFTYNSTAGIATTGQLNVGSLVTVQDVKVDNGEGGVQTGMISVTIPDDAAEGEYTVHLQLKNDASTSGKDGVKDNNKTANTSVPGAVSIPEASASEATETTLSIMAADATYTGAAYDEANITPTLTAGALGTISYKYYSDAEGLNEISAPISAGTYYVQAHFASDDTDQWTDADSGIVEFTIEKLEITGDAVTQAALNVAKMGTLDFTITNAKLVGEDTMAVFDGAKFTLTIGATEYTVESTASVSADGTAVYVSWKMNDTLKAALGEYLVSTATSANKAVQLKLSVGAETENYIFDSESFTTKLFSSLK